MLGTLSLGLQFYFSPGLLETDTVTGSLPVHRLPLVHVYILDLGFAFAKPRVNRSPFNHSLIVFDIDAKRY